MFWRNTGSPVFAVLDEGVSSERLPVQVSQAGCKMGATKEERVCGNCKLFQIVAFSPHASKTL